MRKPNSGLVTKVSELMALRRLSEELQAEINALQEAVKDFMGEEETMITGAFSGSCKRVTSCASTAWRSGATCPTSPRGT